MVGILVCGDNHFIVDGPKPSRDEAIALAQHWTFIQIGRITPSELRAWKIVTREFRENLQWAMVVDGNGGMSPAVAILLEELSRRGISTGHTDRATFLVPE